ncbi:16S rRNA (guanine(966)-N(2))-methyltransferase RsmD [Mogibacterium diversum]|uniref:16S rRNA (guanine(966)-N(2))-methyltransferase RsmD n=1 Tax=Mogibacterium diversum TaxID=114527 RepID=UPI0028D2FD69|nr:16S rRNA (guanine(966)-N(2))-methyltransferase RsmD [Mogibacterium diversum]
MRINSGRFKYRKLEIPESARPTTEKVREAVFSMLINRVEGATVLDLFAGSGSLGLEALSRGAEFCVFNEGDRKNYKILKNNITNCKAEEISSTYNNDFRKALTLANREFDIIFVDPPYREGYYGEVFELVEEYGLLTGGGVIVVEHLNDNELSDNILGFSRIKHKRYGTIGVDFFERA